MLMWGLSLLALVLFCFFLFVFVVFGVVVAAPYGCPLERQ